MPRKGDRWEVCKVCGARNLKNDTDGSGYTEAHEARAHRLHDRVVEL